MLVTIVNKINKKMSILISNSNPNTTILNTVIVRKNLNYITKFGLSPTIA